MSYSITIAEEVEIEIMEAKVWYESKSSGLGDSFVSAVTEAIFSLTDDRVDYKPAFKNTRRLLVKNFPFVIYYRRDEKKKDLGILAVLHNKQSTQDIETRL